MSHPYTGDPNAAWSSATTLPDDGPDERDAASVNVPFEDILNKTEYLKALRHDATSVERWLRDADYVRGTTLGTWTPQRTAGSRGGWVHHHTADDPTAATIEFALIVPHGATLKRIDCAIDPAAHTAKPATMPRVILKRWEPANIAGGAISDVATIIDTALTASDYEQPHVFGGDVNVVIDHETYEYRVVFQSELGTDSEDALTLAGIRVRFDMTNLDEGAS
ncbi:MAG: hypothetical protein HOW73_34625 [Polyangiaceae bacterium]|nr:hypothetical protein [Polyangiaceae bacterium]